MATSWPGSGLTRRHDRARSFARPLLVPMAAAGGRHRGQHRRGLSHSATSRSIAPIRGTTSEIMRPCASYLFKSLVASALDRTAPPVADERCWSSWRQTLDRAARRTPRPQSLDPRGGCRILQWLRARDPCAEQRFLRPRALRACVSLPRRATPTCSWSPGRSRATCARRSSARIAQRPIRSGSLPSAIARSTAGSSPAAMRASAACRQSSPSTSTFAVVRQIPTALLQGLIALVDKSASSIAS